MEYALVEFDEGKRKVKQVVRVGDIRGLNPVSAQNFNKNTKYDIKWQKSFHSDSYDHDGYYPGVVLLLAASLKEIRFKAKEMNIRLPQNIGQVSPKQERSPMRKPLRKTRRSKEEMNGEEVLSRKERMMKTLDQLPASTSFQISQKIKVQSHKSGSKRPLEQLKQHKKEEATTSPTKKLKWKVTSEEKHETPLKETFTKNMQEAAPKASTEKTAVPKNSQKAALETSTEKIAKETTAEEVERNYYPYNYDRSGYNYLKRTFSDYLDSRRKKLEETMKKCQEKDQEKCQERDQEKCLEKDQQKCEEIDQEKCQEMDQQKCQEKDQVKHNVSNCESLAETEKVSDDDQNLGGGDGGGDFSSDDEDENLKGSDGGGDFSPDDKKKDEDDNLKGSDGDGDFSPDDNDDDDATVLLDRIRNEHKKCEGVITSLRKKKNELSSSVHQLEKENEDLKGAVKVLKKRMDALTEEKNQLMSFNFQKENEELKGAVKVLQKRMDALTEEKNQLTTFNFELQKQLFIASGNTKGQEVAPKERDRAPTMLACRGVAPKERDRAPTMLACRGVAPKERDRAPTMLADQGSALKEKDKARRFLLYDSDKSSIHEDANNNFEVSPFPEVQSPKPVSPVRWSPSSQTPPRSPHASENDDDNDGEATESGIHESDEEVIMKRVMDDLTGKKPLKSNKEGDNALVYIGSNISINKKFWESKIKKQKEDSKFLRECAQGIWGTEALATRTTEKKTDSKTPCTPYKIRVLHGLLRGKMAVRGVSKAEQDRVLKSEAKRWLGNKLYDVTREYKAAKKKGDK